MFVFFFVCFALFLWGWFIRNKRTVSKSSRCPSVVFLHPDLGIGGAERLILDAAVGLYRMGHSVFLVTNYHDRNRAFPETTHGPLARRVTVKNGCVPRHIFGRAHVLCATLRMGIAAVWLCLFGPDCDVYIVDQVAAAMPVLRLLTRRPVLFYCHFPDQLCDPQQQRNNSLARPSRLHRIYRLVFDTLEEVCFRCASSIVCNSQFTRQVTLGLFPGLRIREDDVFYPPVDVEALREPSSSAPEVAEVAAALEKKSFVLSINRYERKKNIALAIRAFARARNKVPSERNLHLVIAGGYDPRLAENVEHYQELTKLAEEEGVLESTTFLRSVSHPVKKYLLESCLCVVYTPRGEHFGIVPVEAMALGKVVVAVNNAGPLESIKYDGQCGLLCEDTPDAFADALVKVATDSDLCARIGVAARERCDANFSITSFSRELSERVHALAQGKCM